VPIATLCYGPWVLASAGILAGRTLTSWPGIRDDLVDAGAIWLDRAVVGDGNLVTSRGPQDIAACTAAMRKLFSGAEAGAVAEGSASPETTGKTGMTLSAPQRDKPPSLVLRAMRWAPRPSLRTALAVGMIAALMGPSRRRKR
jgi:protease I